MKKAQTAVVVIEVVIVVLLVAGMISLFRPMLASTLGHYPGFSISMGYVPMQGQGIDRLEIDGDGSVRYNEGCGRLPCIPVKRYGRISPLQVAELVSAIRFANLWALKDNFVSSDSCQDCTMIEFGITLNGQRKHIAYPEEACGNANISDPWGTCSLQHKLEAIRQSVVSLPTPTPGNYPDLHISLSTCGGMSMACEQVAIDGDGNVSYGGVSGKINPQQVTELVFAMKLADIWDMKEGYVADLPCSDCPAVDFTATLNGQSKHIQYRDGDCGMNADGAPPKAFCDFQDDVRSTAQSIIPRPTPPPAPTPGPTPVPTLPAAILAGFGDFGIVSQEPCGPPCFLGVRPGVTTFDDAVRMLKNAGLPCNVQDVQPSGKALSCSSSDGSVTMATTGLCLPNDISPLVGGIGLVPPVKITAGEFIAKYGPPDSVIVRPVGGQQGELDYESLQTFVFLATQPGGSYTVSPDTAIQVAVYVRGDEYPMCIQQMAAQDVQPWKGYGTYAPVVRP